MTQSSKPNFVASRIREKKRMATKMGLTTQNTTAGMKTDADLLGSLSVVVGFIVKEPKRAVI